MNWLELLAGAVLGVVGAAALEEGLRRKLHALLSRLAVRKSHHAQLSAFNGDRFILGALSVPFRLVEGDGTRIITRANVQVEVDPTKVKLPSEMAVWRKELEQQLRTSPERHIWNGLRYSVAGVECGRTPRREDPRVYIKLRHADYFHFLTVQQLDREFADRTTPRQRYVDGPGLDNIPDFMFASLGICVTAVTADQFLIVTRRSGKLGTGRDEWNVSANEGLSRDLDASGRHPPDLYKVAERGLVEELALAYGEYDLSMLGIGLECKRYHWAVFFLAHLRSLTARELQDRHARGIPDRWEHRTIDYVPFQPGTVVTYILQHDRINHWAPAAPPAIWLALTNVYGRPRMERVARRT